MKDNSSIPIVLLCGGKGTRLREMTDIIPKPMVDVGGRPILWHIMKYFSCFNHTNFIACLGYKGYKIKEYFLNYEIMQSDITIDIGRKNNNFFHNYGAEEDWKITLVETGEESMTGCRIKRIEKYVNSDIFMLTYGDGLCDVDIKKLLNFHMNHGKIGTVTGVYPSSRFGELLVNGDCVKKFSEKPQISEGRINGGFFVFNKSIFDYVSDNESCIFEKEPLEKLAEDGQLMIFKHDGFWQCVDTLRDIEYIQKLWQDRNCPWKKW